MSKKKWRCYFCDEVLTTKEKAALHFGVFESCEPDEVACKMLSKPQEAIAKYIRELEGQVRELQEQVHNETHPLLEALQDAQYEAESRVRNAEEKGYLKGVNDMKAQGYCSEPAKHEI